MNATATKTAPETIPLPTAAPQARGFKDLPCPLCASEGTVNVNLSDLDVFTCSDCENEFTAESVRDFIARWQRVLGWIEQAPALTD